MESFNKLIDIVSKLRSEDGCPWDREQTHKSLKAACIEEAVEVIAGIDILEETGNPESLKEELGDRICQFCSGYSIGEYSIGEFSGKASVKMK